MFCGSDQLLYMRFRILFYHQSDTQRAWLYHIPNAYLNSVRSPCYDSLDSCDLSEDRVSSSALVCVMGDFGGRHM